MRTSFDDQRNLRKGLKICKEVLGAPYVEKSLDAADDFNRDIQRLVTESCWGAGWGREDQGLTRRDRSLLNLVMRARATATERSSCI